MFGHQGVKMLRLANVVVNPFPNLACTVSLETHPHFKPAKASRLLEAVKVILVAFIGTIEFVGKICRLNPKGCG